MNNVVQLYHHDEEQPAKVLLYDVENTPITIRAWRTWDADAIRVVDEWYMLSFAWKWLDEKQTQVLGLDDFPNFNKDPADDSDLIKKLHELFNQADILIAHNGNRHDQRKSNTRFVYHGLTPPSPYQQIDTYRLAKKKFSFSSNSLADLAKFLKVPVGKKKILPEVWEECMQGNRQAFAELKSYNKRDVAVLESVYKRLRGWDPAHPSIGRSSPRRPSFASLENLTCPRCGSVKLSSMGWRRTVASRFRRYQCLNCGGFVSSTVRFPAARGGKAI